MLTQGHQTTTAPGSNLSHNPLDMFISRFFSVLLALTACTTCALATGIIFPLYIYPASAPSCDAWSPLITAIAANPSVTFYVVVNPASGPGGANTQPNSDYQGCVPKLRASNVKIVGYVDTANGNRASSAVIQDIETYAGWSSSYRPTGIFFDDVTPSSGLFSSYSTWTSQARTSFGSSAYVILNPGSGVGTTSYFTIANQIITAETYYSDFSPSQLFIGSSSPASKQSVILHDGPTTVPSSLISTLVSDGVGSLFITDDTQASGNPYGRFPAAWTSFVSTVAADN